MASVAAALPDLIVGNAPIAARLGVEPEWIAAPTGVRQRRIASDGKLHYSYAAVSACPRA